MWDICQSFKRISKFVRLVMNERIVTKWLCSGCIIGWKDDTASIYSNVDRNCLDQFCGVPWNQTSDAHQGYYTIIDFNEVDIWIYNVSTPKKIDNSLRPLDKSLCLPKLKSKTVLLYVFFR